MIKPGNRGEWAEIYIFLKLIAAGKIKYGNNLQKKEKSCLQIQKIIREEISGKVFEYIISDGDLVKVHCNKTDVGPDYCISKYKDTADKTLGLINSSKKGNGIFDKDIAAFLEEIHINKLKSPGKKTARFFGGTQDIVMEVHDSRTGIDNRMGFSCKSKFSSEATLFNASKVNTSFRFKVRGPVNDDVKDEFNNLFNKKTKTDKESGEEVEKLEVAIGKRMKFLKEKGCELEFSHPCSDITRRNLIMSGGLEMPKIMGEMLRYYFFLHNGESEYRNISKILRYLEAVNPVEYDFDNLFDLYKYKVGSLLYNMFTGMRMTTPWDGHQDVSGGYINVSKNGDVIAYHVSFPDKFKDYLVSHLSFEAPSTKRHEYLKIYKDEKTNDYYLDLNLQIRFTKSEIELIDGEIEQIQTNTKKLQEKLNKQNEILEKRKKAKKPNISSIKNVADKIEAIQIELASQDEALRSAEIRKQMIPLGNGFFE